MGRFSRKFKNRLVKEQKKAMNKIYKRVGMEGLLSTLAAEARLHETEEHTSSLDVEAQEGQEISEQEEAAE